MDFQAFVDTVDANCAVLSVQKMPDGTYGEIRILCANQRYKDGMGPAYYDNMMYYELVPKDLKFEDFCYRSALLGQRMHAYVEVKAMNGWIDQLYIPLEGNDELGYCQFIYEFTQAAEFSRQANVSRETSEAVIRATLAMLNEQDFVEGIREVLRDFLNISEGFSCRIMLVDNDEKTTDVLCEEFHENAVTNFKPGEVELPYDLVASWESMIGVSNDVIVKDERDMSQLEQRNPDWVASLRNYGVKSLVLVPLREQGELIGYLYVTNFNVERVVLVKELVELLSYIMGPRISNYLLLKKLEIMSNVDSLTGLLNRHAMSRRIHELSESGAHKPFGVINMDLNGLKAVNDDEGHDAGDRLLVEASEIMQKVFHREDLFRTGGDEFIVITPGIERDVFERKVERLRADVEKNAHVSFALGSYWSDGSVDVRTAFINADEHMYADKRAYYELHPEMYRR